MPDRQPVRVKNLDSNNYGLEPIPWSRPHDQLAVGPSRVLAHVLGTVRPDGRPHAAVVGAAWHDGDIYFTSSPGARKARDLAANPACTVTVRLTDVDVVLEGEAHRVTDKPTLDALAAIYQAAGWPAEVAGDAFTAPYSAPSAGPPPWHLYRFRFDRAYGVGTTEPSGATAWYFE